MTTTAPIHRTLFVATILTGSFLLFLIQPMVARMALPQLGGAPNVWNSAMLVYQALLLAGYAYAHGLSRMTVQRQAMIHIGLLLVAALTLPIALAELPPPASGQEAWWVPLLFLASIGPVFFLVSAQAPLMQRWFSAHPGAGEPWALYAASNLGSFAGLIAYPILVEPLLKIGDQSLGWSLGYGLLIILIAGAAFTRRHTANVVQPEGTIGDAERVPARRIILWLALAAVPSGLMLSTTTHLTTDIFAMPLLWVIPLGLYLLSFVAAFSDRRGVANAMTMAAPVLMVLTGGLAMVSHHSGTLMVALSSVVLLFAVSVSLHARLYQERPEASQLTLFYLVMSAGGALGGLFTALIAPLIFDWVWEHPILVFIAAALIPLPPLIDWRKLRGLDPSMAQFGSYILLAVAAFMAWHLRPLFEAQEPGMARSLLALGLAVIGLLLMPWRWMYLAVLLVTMLAQGGVQTIKDSASGARTRSYFGIYTVRDYHADEVRTLTHGTTLHGQQSLVPARKRDPLTYYGPGSGIGIALAQAPALFGGAARVGIVGLGTGTLACYRQPGQVWHYFEIDPAVLRYSRDGTFTYMRDCAPDARVVLGDARLELARLPRHSFDVLAIDAFSSDSIPLHLLTDEAFGIYLNALSDKGVLVVHISNRYIELEPPLAALARKRGLAVLKRSDAPIDQRGLTASTWVVLARHPAQLQALAKAQPDYVWEPLLPPSSQVWTDNHASVLPYVQWRNLLQKGQ